MIQRKDAHFESLKVQTHRYQRSPRAFIAENSKDTIQVSSLPSKLLFDSKQQILEGLTNQGSSSTIASVGTKRLDKDIKLAIEENKQTIKQILKESALVC